MTSLEKLDRGVVEIVEALYSGDMGRPGIDPVVLIKLAPLQHLYGLSSLRRVASEASENVCCRWFLGYSQKRVQWSTGFALFRIGFVVS